MKNMNPGGYQGTMFSATSKTLRWVWHSYPPVDGSKAQRCSIGLLLVKPMDNDLRKASPTGPLGKGMAS